MRIMIRDVEFSSPLLTASGTYGYGHEVQDLVTVDEWGGIITKSVTRHPREGNPPPRIAETSSGMLNSIGLANLGVEQYCQEIIPSLNVFCFFVKFAITSYTPNITIYFPIIIQ